MLSGGLLLDVVESRDWCGRIKIDPNLLLIDSRWRENLDRVPDLITRLGYTRLLRWPNQQLVPSGYDFGVSRYRNYGEVSYGSNISQFDVDHFESALMIKIESNMICWARPILLAKFGHLRHSETQASFF